MNRAMNSIGIAVLLLVGASGCGESVQATSDEALATIDKSKYVLAEEPDGLVGVLTARAEAKDEDDIVLLGRIGGRANPWIEGRSAFMVIDASMMVVADGQENGAGEVCLDDCCATLRTNSTMLVKIVDDEGRTLPIDSRELMELNPNDIVIVKGKIERDKDKCTVAATGVYVRK